jgi:hypothetical protein
MSGFAGRNSQADTGQTKLSGMKVQTTVLGRCIPWVFGTNRVAPNVIQWDDFQAIEKKQKQGGKGGGGESTSYEYKAAVILAICRGPISGVGTIWADKKKHTTTSLGLDLYTGTDVQTAHPHWATNHAATALPYRGLAYAAKASMDLGSGGSVDRHTFEIKSATRVSDTIPDARIENVITALLTDKLDGVGLLASKLGDLAQLANFCAANSIFASPAYDDQKAAKDALVRLAEIAQCGMFWSDGALKFVPYSDTAATGNGATYTPAVASIPELTADDLLPDGDGPPIKIKRKGAADAKNHFQIKYSDRSNEYNAATVESKDLGSIERFGVLSAEPDEFAEICVGHVAQKLADFRRDRAGAVRTTYEFRLSLRWDRLEPMDIVALTYAPDGMAQYTVRITSIEEGDEGDLRVEAEDCPLGSQQVVQITPQSPAGGGVDYNQSPGNVAAPVMFEPPLSLTGGTPEVWIATSGGPLWGGAEMHVSTDGSTYQRVAEVTAKARHGALTATLPVGGVIDTVSTLAVSLGVSGGVLLAGTMQDATDLSTLCYAGGELLAYRDATLTGVNTYNLQYLVRGAHGTDITAHAAGSLFTRLDDAVLRYPYDKQWVGRTIYVKFTARNIFGAGQQSLADVPAYTYLITGAPLAGVQNLALLKPWVGGEAQIKWDLVDGATSYDVEALAGAPLATVRSVSNVTSGQWTYSADDARADGGPWRSIALRVRPVAVTGRKGPWSQITASNPQISALAGLSITPMAKQAAFQCTQPADLDFAGIQVWVSTTLPVATTAANLVYDGPDVFTTINKLANGTALAAGTTYYLKAAGYDAFGKDALAYSSELTFTVAGMVPDVGSVIATMLADGAVTTAKFAAGLEPVSISTAPSLPTTKTTEALVWHGKLYRWSGTAYVSSVPAGDLTGQLTDVQIAAVAAAKVTGTLTASQLAVSIGGGNLIPNSSFEVDSNTDGWADNWGNYLGFGTPTIDTDSKHGARSQRVLAIGSIANPCISLQGNRPPITAGSTYVISAWAKADVGQTLLLGCKTFAVATGGAEMGTFAQSIVVAASDSWQRLSITVTPSANSFISPTIGLAGTPAAGTQLRVDAVQVEQGDMITAYAPKPDEILPGTITGTEISDNAITTPKLSAGAVVAGKIAANAVSANEIAAGSITTSKLSAGAVTANELSAGAVTAGKIAAGAVTATEISAGAITAGKIAAGSITASELAANSIVAGKIAAGAISATEVAAGAITTDKMLVTGTNLVANGDFASGDLKNWRPFAGATWMSVVAASTAGVPAGAPSTNVCQIAWGGGSSSVAVFAAAKAYSDVGANADGFELRAGTEYDVKIWAVKSSDFANTTTSQLIAFYLKSDGTVNNQIMVINLSALVGTSWSELSGSFVAPAGAIRCWLYIYVPAMTAGKIWFTRLRARDKYGSDLIVDGSIISSKILAGAVTADKITANAVTADKISAGAITTDKIAAGAVTAAHISSGLPGGNLIPNSAFAATYLDAGGVLQADGHTFSTAAVIPVGVLTSGLNLAGTAWQLTGVNTLSLRQTGVDGAGNGTAYADMAGPTWPVVGGQPYEFSFYSGALRCSVTGYVTWRDVAGAVITFTALPTNAAEAGGGQALSGYKRLFAVAAAPAGAVTAQLTYRKLATLAGQADSWMFVVCPMGAPALSAAQSAPSPWVPTGLGTQISGGVIKTGTLTADKISVTQLSAISANLGAITAGSLNINNRFIVAADGTTTIRSAASGQRTELDNQQMRVYDSNGVMRVRLGIW